MSLCGPSVDALFSTSHDDFFRRSRPRITLVQIGCKILPKKGKKKIKLEFSHLGKLGLIVHKCNINELGSKKCFTICSNQINLVIMDHLYI